MVYPTETLYALGCLATVKKSVRRLNRIKKRPKDNLFPVIVGSVQQARRFFFFSPSELRAAKLFWPGPLSLVLRVKSSSLRNAIGADRIAVRISKNQIASKLARESRAPIVSTSANLSGQYGCFTLRCVKRYFGASSPKPDFFLNGGRLQESLPSTLLIFEKRKWRVLREGKIPSALLQKKLGGEGG